MFVESPMQVSDQAIINSKPTKSVPGGGSGSIVALASANENLPTNTWFTVSALRCSLSNSL